MRVVTFHRSAVFLLTIALGGCASYLQQGEFAEMRNDHDAAIAAFTAAIQNNQTVGIAYTERAASKAFKGDLDGAISDTTATINGDRVGNPHYVEAFLIRGTAKALKQDYDGAVDDFTQGIQHDVGHQDGYALHAGRGFIQFRKGSYAEAQADFQSAIQGAPIRLPQVRQSMYVAISYAQIALGKYDEAIGQLTTALSMDEQNQYAYSARALAYWAKGDKNASSKDAQAALGLANADLMNQADVQGVMALINGDNDGAIADWKKALARRARGIELERITFVQFKIDKATTLGK